MFIISVKTTLLEILKKVRKQFLGQYPFKMFTFVPKGSILIPKRYKSAPFENVPLCAGTDFIPLFLRVYNFFCDVIAAIGEIRVSKLKIRFQAAFCCTFQVECNAV